MFFFFSSRRRHTRFDCDWSSDVCSSDLTVSVAQPECGIPQLVPHEREVGIELDRLLQRGEGVAIAPELDERRPLERERERRIAELGPRTLGKPQRVLGPDRKSVV